MCEYLIVATADDDGIDTPRVDSPSVDFNSVQRHRESLFLQGRLYLFLVYNNLLLNECLILIVANTDNGGDIARGPKGNLNETLSSQRISSGNHLPILFSNFLYLFLFWYRRFLQKASLKAIQFNQF